MKITSIEAVIRGRNDAMQSLLDSLPDVPEKYRADDIPSWANTYKLKRHLFNWLNSLGKVQMYVQPVEPGVLLFKVNILFLKGWSFALTPELVYLMANITLSATRDKACDLTFLFRGRRVFLPFELAARFICSIDEVLMLYNQRVTSIHESMAVLRAEAEAPKEEEQPEGKEKRVLH